MRIAIDARPLQEEGAINRGIGRYSLCHLSAIMSLFPEWEFILCTDLPHHAEDSSLKEFFLQPQIQRHVYDTAPIPSCDLFHMLDSMGILRGYDSPFLLRPKNTPSTVIFYDLTPIIQRSSHFDAWPQTHRFAYLERLRQLRLGDVHILSISANTKNDLVQLQYMPPHRITPIMAGCFELDISQTNLPQPQAVLSKYGLTSPFFMYVGSLDPHKNVQRMFDAFLTLHRDQAVSLLIAGSLSDPFKQRYKEDLKRKGIKGINFAGFVPDPDLVALYQQSLGLVFPSLYEGFGFPVLEAMQYGCPVITADSSSLPEVAGDAALLINAEDTAAITNAMRRLAGDKELRNNLIEKGKLQASRFSWKRTAEQTAEIWQRLVDHTNATARKRLQASTEKQGISFCLCGQATDLPVWAKTIASIDAQMHPHYEICVGGTLPQLPFDSMHCKDIDISDCRSTVEIYERLVKSARFSTVVLCKSAVVFTPSFCDELLSFTTDAEVQYVVVLNPDGTRFWDWCAVEPETGEVTLIDYHVETPTSIGGGAVCALKRNFAIELFSKIQTDPLSAPNTNNSLTDAKSPITLAFNPNAVAINLDPSFTQYESRPIKIHQHPAALSNVSRVLRTNGVYPGFQSRHWLTSSAQIIIPKEFRTRPYQLTLELTCLDAESYNRFPFIALMSLMDGNDSKALNFGVSWQSTSIGFTVEPSYYDYVLSLESTAVLKDSNLRTPYLASDLSLLLTGIAVRSQTQSEYARPSGRAKEKHCLGEASNLSQTDHQNPFLKGGVKQDNSLNNLGLHYEGTVFDFSSTSACSTSFLSSARLAGQRVDVACRSRRLTRLEQLKQSDPDKLLRLEQRTVSAGLSAVQLCPSELKTKEISNRFFAETADYKTHWLLTECPTSKVSAAWVALCERFSLVLVPSAFDKTVLLESGVYNTQIHVLPLSLDLERFSPETASSFDIQPRPSTLFLTVIEDAEADGLDILLKGYAAAFSKSDSVGLLLYAPALSSSDPLTNSSLPSILTNLGIDPSTAPEVTVLEELLNEQLLPCLYASVDCFVLPNRSSANRHAMLAAAAMGLPIIASNWGAHTAFLNEENAHLIPVREYNQIILNEAVGHWASPDEQGLIKALQAIATAAVLRFGLEVFAQYTSYVREQHNWLRHEIHRSVQASRMP